MKSSIFILDLVKGYNVYHKGLKLGDDETFKNIHILSPTSLDEFLAIIDCLKDEVKKIRNDKQVRLIIVDSLSMPILCTINDPIKRPYLYSQVLHKLHQVTLENELAIVITNELITQVDKNGKIGFGPAGGQAVCNYVHTKVKLTNVINDKFAVRVIKSPTLPEISENFMITEDGIRDII